MRARVAGYPNTPLHHAVTRGYDETLSALLDLDLEEAYAVDMRPASVDVRMPYITPFLLACMLNDQRTALLLFDSGAYPNPRTSTGVTPLLYAIRFGMDTLVRVLWEVREVNLNQRTCVGYGVLHFASQYCRYDLAQFLVEEQYDPEEAAEDGNTPVTLAQDRRMLDILDLRME